MRWANLLTDTRARESERALVQNGSNTRVRGKRDIRRINAGIGVALRARAPTGLPPCEFETARQAIFGNVETGEQSGAGRGNPAIASN